MIDIQWETAAPDRRPSSEAGGQGEAAGQDSLDGATAEYAAHYHEERNHQGIGNEMSSGGEG